MHHSLKLGALNTVFYGAVFFQLDAGGFEGSMFFLDDTVVAKAILGKFSYFEVLILRQMYHI